jgi:cation-transporting ATPase 13A1
VPDAYDATYKQFAAQGARVIALAHKQLPAGLSGPELRALPREEAEADMAFVGFAVFQVFVCGGGVCVGVSVMGCCGCAR